MRTDLLNILPVSNSRVVVSNKQKINDIIREVIKAHAVFHCDYLLICDEFYSRDKEVIFHKIFKFCKDNLEYQIESEEDQTTKSPGQILRTKNDCKHYAGFIGGILDALNQKYNTNIVWYYRFASYNYFNSLPSHVFVVAKDGGKTFWIDPVLKKFNDRSIKPVFTDDKKIKNNTMLTRISGVDQAQFVHAVKMLNDYNILSTSGLNRDNYILALDTAPPFMKTQLRNSYVAVKNATSQGSIGGVWDVVGKILQGVGNAIAPAAPVVAPYVPPAPVNTLNKYLPYILLGGVGIFAVIEFTKK